MSFTKLLNNPILVLAVIVWIYVLIPFLAPISYVKGNEFIGKGINDFYEFFCHQRVERSIFLFGTSSPIAFHSVGELKEFGYLPSEPEEMYKGILPDYYGHDYVGDSEVGYKVPLCIRDLALYFSLAIMLTVLGILSKSSRLELLSWKHIYLLGVLLSLPMVLDGIVQTILELAMVVNVPAEYINSIPKRVVTGVLFGFGIGLIVSKLFEMNSLTNSSKKGKI